MMKIVNSELSHGSCRAKDMIFIITKTPQIHMNFLKILDQDVEVVCRKFGFGLLVQFLRQ